MRRSLVFALMLSLGHASVALAGETLLQSGKRIVQQLSEAPPASASVALDVKRLRGHGGVQTARQAQTATLAESRMRKRTKILIGMGVAMAFGVAAYAIDQGVEDSTPSSLGLR